MTRNEQIVALRREGLSFGAIGKRIGVTRCAVAGVCNRAGLCVPLGYHHVGRPPRRTRGQILLDTWAYAVEGLR